MSMLNITQLSKSFGTNKVIDGVEFSVPEGSIFGFIGPNGAGKTTTMKMALGLLEIDSGEIVICGEKAEFGKTAKEVGYLPDVPEFYNYMKPIEYLTLCGEISGMSKAEIKNRGGELLELVGLSKVNRKVGGFSRGMKQRLGMAQALLNKPKLLICDEPTSALDPVGRKEILDILGEIRGETTVVFSTHILSDVERICDRAVFLHGGKIVLDGEISELKRKHSESYSIEFAEPKSAERMGALFVDAVVEKNTVTIKNSSGEPIIKALNENNLIPIKFELLEYTLEDLYLEALSDEVLSQKTKADSSLDTTEVQK